MASAAEQASNGSSEEKKIGDEQLEREQRHTIENLPDPDEGLSEEERAAQVRCFSKYIHSQRETNLSLQDRKLLRKLDLKLIPWLSFLYLISFLDRTNIGNAKVDGLQQDLNMTDSQYNLSLTIFFISYSVFEPLTNILLKKLRPSVFLPIIMIWWYVENLLRCSREGKD
jgi:hypothetical protein